MTALHRAAMSGSDAACQVLLRAGAGGENSPPPKIHRPAKRGGVNSLRLFIFIYIYIVYIILYFLFHKYRHTVN